MIRRLIILLLIVGCEENSTEHTHDNIGVCVAINFNKEGGEGFIDDDDVMYSCIQFINTHSECSLWHADFGINDTDQNLVWFQYSSCIEYFQAELSCGLENNDNSLYDHKCRTIEEDANGNWIATDYP